jgi:hypothetical protein
VQNNPNNIYLKKVEELFAENIFIDNAFFKFAQLIPAIRYAIARIFSADSAVRLFINTHILPLITKKELYVTPFVWLLNRLHIIVERRQQTPISRVDLLQLMLQVITKEAIHVGKILKRKK